MTKELLNYFAGDELAASTWENKYALRFRDPKEGEWCRVGLAEGYSWEDHEYYFVDPSGGPFLSVGRSINEDLEITRIYLEENAYVFEVKKIKKD